MKSDLTDMLVAIVDGINNNAFANVPVQNDDANVDEFIDDTFSPEWKQSYYSEETKDFGKLMYKYCICGLWDKGTTRNDAMEKIKNTLRENYKSARVDSALRRAEAWLNKARQIYEAAVKREFDTEAEAKAIEEMGGPLKKEIGKTREKKRENKKKGEAIMAHIVKIKSPLAKTATPSPQVTVQPMTGVSREPVAYQGHPNDIFRLKPAASWDLFIDESGADENFLTAGKGVIAGVLTDRSCILPEKPGLHAATDNTKEKLAAGDKLIETMLNHPQCGVLAIPARAYESARGWGSLIASYIDLVLRFLPLDYSAKETTLNVHVENRGNYKQNIDFSFIRDACLYNIMHVYPEKANRIKLQINVMKKDCPWDSYPDLVAHTCFRHSKLAKDRFKLTGWNGTCFLNYSAEQLKNILDYFFLGRKIEPQDWNELLESGAGTGTGLIDALLNNIGNEARQDVALWTTYLNFTVQHLNSKAINMRRLSQQLEWLQKYQPAKRELPPRLKLLWLTSILAEANHRGNIEEQSPAGQEFMRLTRELYEEDAPLVCQAVLHLAVQRTNEFLFEEAKKLLTDFSDIGSLLEKDLKDAPRNYVPAAIPGLRFYGQMLSSLGQHEAFLGDNRRAAAYFKEAIACFERLSENKFLDIDQTTAYYATAQMDLDPASPETTALMERYLDKDIVSAGKELAVSSDPMSKYHHHILLRYLATGNNREAIDAYLEQKTQWATGEGHPWEMIEFYRAMLLMERGCSGEAEARLHMAVDILGPNPGSTLRLIKCVILGALHFYGWDSTGFAENMELAIQELPALGEKRSNALRRQLTAPVPPMELAKAVLPFNFR